MPSSDTIPRMATLRSRVYFHGLCFRVHTEWLDPKIAVQRRVTRGNYNSKDEKQGTVLFVEYGGTDDCDEEEQREFERLTAAFPYLKTRLTFTSVSIKAPDGTVHVLQVANKPANRIDGPDHFVQVVDTHTGKVVFDTLVLENQHKGCEAMTHVYTGCNVWELDFVKNAQRDELLPVAWPNRDLYYGSTLASEAPPRSF